MALDSIAPDARLAERPFQRSGVVGREYFWNRADEQARLRSLIAAGEIGFVEGPRRVGKSSLALLLREELQREQGWRIGYLNLRSVTSATLPDRLVSVIAALAHKGRAAQMADRVRNLIGWFRIRPEVGAEVDEQGRPRAVLRFAQYRVADQHIVFEDIVRFLHEAPKHAGTKVALVIDEFQEVASLAPDLPGLLKAEFESGKDLAIVLMGSRQSLLHELAYSPSAPLYRIGPTIPVGELPLDIVELEMQRRFGWAGIPVSSDVAASVHEVCAGIAQDIQTVCSVMLDHARQEHWSVVDAGALPQVLTTVLREVAPRFMDVWLELSPIQQELLSAIAQFGGSSITGKDFLEAMNPHLRRTSSVVVKASRALRDRDLLELDANGYRLADPFFALYLRRVASDPDSADALVS